MKHMIEVRDLSFSYREYSGSQRLRPILSALGRTVEEGERMLILGPPDSGKSTLSRILCALVPRHAEGELSGVIRIAGEDLVATEPWELTRAISLVTQNPQEQLMMTTCADEIAFPLESLGSDRDIIVRRVDRALETWGLTELAEVNPQELSGGERKRLLLAVTDAIDAPVWIMDEPFDDLDELWRARLMDHLTNAARTVLVFASRYLDEFRGSFDAYGRIHDHRISFGAEERIVIDFERESEQLFTAFEQPGNIDAQRRLAARDLTIIHARRSASSAQPFRLRVEDFHIDSGEVVALVGPNGAGKSTLSRVLCGLDPCEEGSLTVDGERVNQKQLQVRVGYLFQNPDYGIFLPSVREEIGWSLRRRKDLSPQERERMIIDCAALFHLDPDENPTMMSYGGRKHLQAAVYHVLDRPFVIIDELDSGVTYAAAFEIVALLRSRGAAVVVITHDRTFAKNLAERQYRIIDGRVVETEVGS